MSSLNQMTVQGIRSFNPKVPERIKFESPVTVLVGQNGSGKTTIIEALKYITTGDMPAGSKGAAFVHDPKISESSEVKGQIKLKLNTAKGNDVILTRSLLVTQKRTKTEFKSLEGVVQMVPKDGGEPTSMSGKCVDLEREAISSLGVSKAVLNNVIFCHQEDSNWPLSEGKVLKSRFDDIFNATKYIKGIDNIKKLAKEQTSEMKIMTAELNAAKEAKEEADKRQKDLGETEKKIKISEENVEKLNERLKPLKIQIEKILEENKKLNELKAEKVKLDFQKSATLKQNHYLKSSITKLYEGSEENLKYELANFTKICEKKEKETVELEKSKIRLNEDISAKQDEEKRLNSAKWQLEAEMSIYQRKIEERRKLIVQLAKDEGWTDFTNFTEDRIQFLSFFKNVIKVQEEKLNSLKADFRRKQEELEEKIQQTLIDRSKIAENIKYKEDSVKQDELEIKKLTAELKEIDDSQKKLTQLEKDVRKIEANLSKIDSEFDEDRSKTEIFELQAEKRQNQIELDRIQAELFEAQKTAEVRSELEQLKNQKTAKLSYLGEFLEKHRSVLNEHFENVPNNELRSAVDQYSKKLSADLRKVEQDLQKFRSGISKNETSRQLVSDQLEAKQKQLKEYEEQILKVSEGEDENFDRLLTKVSDALENLQFEKGQIDGSEFVFKGYKEKLSKKPCCPLCKRNFANENESKGLLNEINRSLENLPSERRRLTTGISEKQKKLKQMHQLQPLVELLAKLKDVDVPELERQKRRLVDEYKTMKKDLNRIEDTYAVLKDQEMTISEMIPDVALIDALQRDTTEIQQKIDILTKKLKSLTSASSSISNRSLNEIREEFEKLQKTQSILAKNLDDRQEQLQQNRERVQNLRQKLNALVKEQLEIEQKQQKSLNLKESVQKLSAKIEENRSEIEKLREKFAPLDRKLADLRGKKREMSAECEQSVKICQEKLENFNLRRSNFDEIAKTLQEFERKNLKDRLTTVSQDLSKIDRSLVDLTNRLTEVNEKFTEITDDLKAQDRMRRNLTDNLEIMQNRKLLVDFDTKIDRFDVEIKALEAAGCGTDPSSLSKQYTELTNQLSEANGRLNEQRETLRRLRAESSQPKYKQAYARYKDKFIDLVVTRTAVDDLRKLEKAFEMCLMNYHREKMTEINSVIRRLWEKVYKGGDIDYIAIRAEMDSQGSSDKRRAYNYRVVMMVNGCELDMRGRCSAGQKMLASIVIRVALAEVFCLNCGILALDEPTTNLDSPNMQSLAAALAELIDERCEQKNFQLILITHDEEFVGILARQHAIDYVYRVYKDQTGFSRLNREHVSGLLSQD